ncbi:MAG: PRC-barrel domain-containing protein [Chloroflexi bacterium]|nr:PRC-barrel domain-containing protein [Chloroflexota bacterium]
MKLGDTDLTISDPQEDIRGRWVIDRNGEEIGFIDDLLIDDQERNVRFLQIASGVVGVGAQTFLVPIDAITEMDDDEIVIDLTRGRIASAPKYDPNVAHDQEYYGNVCRYYGYPP